MTNLRDYARSIPTATMTPQWRGGNSVAWEGKANDFLAAARRRIAGAATSTGAGGGAGAGAGASLPHGDWVCDMCTQQNMSDAPACCMCDSPRGTGNQATPTSATMPEDTALKEGIASCLLTFESQIQGSHRVRVAAVYAGSVACAQPCRAHVGWRPHRLKLSDGIVVCQGVGMETGTAQHGRSPVGVPIETHTDPRPPTDAEAPTPVHAPARYQSHYWRV